jgi:hypothetical protein
LLPPFFTFPDPATKWSILMARFSLLFVSLTFLVGIGWADHHERKLTKHPEFPAEGYEVIYDGSDLSKIQTEGNWQIRDDGTLELVPRPGEKGWQRYGSYLWLPDRYKDFVVDFDFKYDKGGNSGLYFRISDESDATAHGWEVQILDNYGQDKQLTHHDMGGVIATSPPLKNASLKPGEWNQMTVQLVGTHLQVLINGHLVQDFDMSKKKPANKELAEQGKIAIQDHGQPFAVRNIQVKRLD